MRDEPLSIDLLEEPARAAGPMGATARIARERFLDQLTKARLDIDVVRRARLEITPSSGERARACRLRRHR